MKALLLHPDRDFDPHPPEAALPPLAKDLVQDLELAVLWRAMAGSGEDAKLLWDVASAAMLAGVRASPTVLDTILHRQAILKDCLQHPALVRELYGLAVGTMEGKKHFWITVIRGYPTTTLHGALDALRYFAGRLRLLRSFADKHAGRFRSAGFTTLFNTLREELSDEYLARVDEYLSDLAFPGGVLLSADLARGNQAANYALRKPVGPKPTLWERLVRWFMRQFLNRDPPGVTFVLPGPDEAGGRILGEMRDRGLNLVANALAQSSDHIQSFFEMLRTELAFYIGCLNLHEALSGEGGGGTPICFPEPSPAGSGTLRFTELRDAGLVLTMGKGGGAVVGNTVSADGKHLIVVTGANQGGKSSFLRSVGVAQVMMQCGMFVCAESFAGEAVRGVFTHFKREEDKAMKSGKFDEELSRMSGIVDVLVRDGNEGENARDAGAPHGSPLVLFNESFASTDSREGSEIARQIVHALVEPPPGAKVVYVTHLYEFAHGLYEEKGADAMFLRATRLPDGTRLFRLVGGAGEQGGEPLETSYGEDLYREVFGNGEQEEPRASNGTGA